jgi:hypothetical protein
MPRKTKRKGQPPPLYRAKTRRKNTVTETLQDCINRTTGSATRVHENDLQNCFTPKSKSGQLISICDDAVLKGPPVAWQKRHEIRASLRFTNQGEKAVKVDFFTMNLLLQSAIKRALEMYPPADDDVRIEHWDKIVSKPGETHWYMKSQKYSCVDPRFRGQLRLAKDGVITAVTNDLQSIALYDRLLKCKRPKACTLTNTSNNKKYSIKLSQKKNGKLQISKNNQIPIGEGVYSYSHTLLSIEDYLKASLPGDLCKTCALQGTFLKKNVTTRDTPLFTCMICQGEKWVGQIHKTMKWAHDNLQMHHCDVKTAQMLIDSEGNAVVSDLDKATFTLNVANEPVRIRLNRRDENPNVKEYAKTKGKILGHHFDEARNEEHIKYKFTRKGMQKNSGWRTLTLPRQLTRQFESKSHETCNFEVAAYMASYLMLAGGKTRDAASLNKLDDAIVRAVGNYNDYLQEWKLNPTLPSGSSFSHYELNANTIKGMKRKDWYDRNDYMHAEKPIEYRGAEPFQPLKSEVSAHDILEMVTEKAPFPAQRVRPIHGADNESRKREEVSP